MSKPQSPRPVPEAVLRHLWQHRQFSVTNLRTTEGKGIEIVSVGIPNTDGGPDFANAAIRIGGVLYRGDVELHQNYDEWKAHAHDRDPKYNGVILHVVFSGIPATLHPVTKSKRLLPVLVLDQYVSSISENAPFSQSVRPVSTIPCASVNDSIEAVHIQTWLHKLAVERVELKVRRFEERLKELIEERRLSINEPPRRYGTIPFGVSFEEMPPLAPEYTQRDFSRLSVWNQLLYEGVMEALGYSKNQESFIRLAQAISLKFLSDIGTSADGEHRLASTEAVFFGVSGLLRQDHKKQDRESVKRMQLLRRLWKKYKPLYHGEMLNEADWQFFRLRPENFPTVRLAGAARLVPQLLEKDVFKSIVQTVKEAEQEHRRPMKRLKSYFVVDADAFWSTHYCFGTESGATIEKLIGDHRAHDIVLNVALPVCLLYARIFKEKQVRQGALTILEHCSRLSSNVVIRTMEQQLIKGKFNLDSAILQQGVMQLYKLYCLESRCGECEVGNVVFGRSVEKTSV